MKAKASEMFDSLSGRTGNSVIRRINNSLVVAKFTKNKSVLSFPNSDVRYAFGVLTNIWRLQKDSLYPLYNAVRTSYSFFDRFGNLIVPSAYQLFIKLNLPVFKATGNIITAPVVYSPYRQLMIDFTSFDVVNSTFNFCSMEDLAANEFVNVYMSASMRQTPYPEKKYFKFIYGGILQKDVYVNLFPFYIERFSSNMSPFYNLYLSANIVNTDNGLSSDFSAVNIQVSH